jgi:hypothetical protein
MPDSVLGGKLQLSAVSYSRLQDAGGEPGDANRQRPTRQGSGMSLRIVFTPNAWEDYDGLGAAGFRSAA